MWNIFAKDEKGFTGLEAAIVLIAFVVVAAVFSYVMLGSRFLHNSEEPGSCAYRSNAGKQQC